MTVSRLKGLRVLVVEDEMLVALDLAAMLSGLGCVVVGPAPNAAAALKFAQTAPLQGAILDVNLRGQPSFDLADELGRIGVPIIFATGYDESFLPERFRNVPRVVKPIQRATIAETMIAAFVPAQACH
jgi:CheY-like chemotaxis protein